MARNLCECGAEVEVETWEKIKILERCNACHRKHWDKIRAMWKKAGDENNEWRKSKGLPPIKGVTINKRTGTNDG